MKYQLIGIAFVVILLQGCVNGQKRALLSQTERDSIKNLNVYNLVMQDEIRPAVEISNVGGALGGGLIPALIDSSINKGRSLSAQDIIEPLYFATDSVDYRKLIAKEVNAVIAPVYSVMATKETAEAIVLSDSDLVAKIKTLKDGEYLLFLSSFYGFMESSKFLKTDTLAMVFSNKSISSSTKKPVPVYFNRLGYISASVGTGDSDSMGAWSKNNGELFAKTLNESAREIAAQLKYDLQNTSQFECGAIVVADTFAFTGLKIASKSVLVEQKADRAMVRSIGDGALYSVAGTPANSTEKNQKCKQ